MGKISNELVDQINNQIKLELEATYSYNAMAFWLASKSWNHAAKFFFSQAEEEKEHADKLCNFLIELGENIEFQSLNKPQSKYSSVEDLLKSFLEGEEMVTAAIHKLFEIAHKNNDIRAYSILQWFVDEQVEEEAVATEMNERYKYFKGNDLDWDHRLKSTSEES